MYTIAHIENDYTGKFGVPRQSGLVSEVTSLIVFEPEFRNADALRGLESFTHIWLIWEFSEAKRRGAEEENDWRPTVRPPRLGGNTRIGVFATRSPFRPNPIGLSCVELEGIEYETERGPVIRVKGADLMNGTPILDIKPYIPYADCRPEAGGGFTDETGFEKVEVVLPDEVAGLLTAEEAAGLKAVLAQDPRPAYQRGQERAYTFRFSRYDVSFAAKGGILTVTGIKRI